MPHWISPVIHLAQYHASNSHKKKVTPKDSPGPRLLSTISSSCTPASTALVVGVLEGTFLPLILSSRSNSTGFGEEQQFCLYLKRHLGDFENFSHILPQSSPLQLKCPTSVKTSSSGSSLILLITPLALLHLL